MPPPFTLLTAKLQLPRRHQRGEAITNPSRFKLGNISHVWQEMMYTIGNYKDDFIRNELGSQRAQPEDSSNVTVFVKWTLGFPIRSYLSYFKRCLSYTTRYSWPLQSAQREKTKDPLHPVLAASRSILQSHKSTGAFEFR